MLDRNLLNNLLAPYHEQIEKLCNLRRAFNLDFGDIKKSFILSFEQEHYVLKNVYKAERRVLKRYLRRLYAEMTDSDKSVGVLPALQSVEYEVQSELQQEQDSKAVAVVESNAPAVTEQSVSVPATAESGQEEAQDSLCEDICENQENCLETSTEVEIATG